MDFQKINEKIKSGRVAVMAADELLARGREEGFDAAAARVDVVTTGTFGPLCAAGAFLDLGDMEFIRRVREVSMNGVPVYHGSGYTPFYIGISHASILSEMPRYGGGHLLESLIRGDKVRYRLFRAEWGETEMRKSEGELGLDEIRQATLTVTRWAGREPFAATNSSRAFQHTEMGALLPRRGNVTYSSAGPLSPAWTQDLPPSVAFSRRVFMGGAPGHWMSAAHEGEAIALMAGDIKRMDRRYFRGGYFERFGPVLYLGVGLAVAPLDAEGWQAVWERISGVRTPLLDYGADREPDPAGEFSYEELASGSVELGGRRVNTAPLSSLRLARKVADRVRRWIERAQMTFIDRRPERQGIDDDE